MKRQYPFNEPFAHYYWTIDFHGHRSVIPFIPDGDWIAVKSIKTKHKKIVKKFNKEYVLQR